MRKRILALSLAVCMLAVLFTGCAKEDKKVIMLTNAGFPPFEYLGADNKPAGVDVDVAGKSRRIWALRSKL
jgi:polar amino acid transport system substrate-binding protein